MFHFWNTVHSWVKRDITKSKVLGGLSPSLVALRCLKTALLLAMIIKFFCNLRGFISISLNFRDYFKYEGAEVEWDILCPRRDVPYGTSQTAHHVPYGTSQTGGPMLFVPLGKFCPVWDIICPIIILPLRI